MPAVFKPRYPLLERVIGPDGKPVMQERVATRGKHKGRTITVPLREPVLDASGKPKYRKSRTWHIRFRDADGIERRVPGFVDKGATQQKASRLEREAARGEVGLTDRFAQHNKRPLTEHLEDYADKLTQVVSST